jgi:hypothetical protein
MREIEKARLAVVTALDNVLRNTGNAEPFLAGHLGNSFCRMISIDIPQITLCSTLFKWPPLTSGFSRDLTP